MKFLKNEKAHNVFYKSCKFQFLCNIWKHQTDFKIKGCKLMVSVLAPTQVIFNPPKGESRREIFLKVRLCVTEDSCNLEFIMVVTYSV